MNFFEDTINMYNKNYNYTHVLEKEENFNFRIFCCNSDFLKADDFHKFLDISALEMYFEFLETNFISEFKYNIYIKDSFENNILTEVNLLDPKHLVLDLFLDEEITFSISYSFKNKNINSYFFKNSNGELLNKNTLSLKENQTKAILNSLTIFHSKIKSKNNKITNFIFNKKINNNMENEFLKITKKEIY